MSTAETIELAEMTELKNQIVAVSTSIDLAKSDGSAFGTQTYLERAQRSLGRMRGHGAVNFTAGEMTHAEVIWTKKGFGLGYRDGNGELTHHFWCDPEDGLEHDFTHQLHLNCGGTSGGELTFADGVATLFDGLARLAPGRVRTRSWLLGMVAAVPLVMACSTACRTIRARRQNRR